MDNAEKGESPPLTAPTVVHSTDGSDQLSVGRPPADVSMDWQPPSAEHLAKLLPQYEIAGLLGRGGMGAVYRGRQPALDRAVAIKILPAELAADGAFAARFQREARTLARLQHPGIVAVYDFGQTSEGHFYFVMEFVDGTDLGYVIHKAKLDARQAMEILCQLCDALQFAHDQGVIHRDVKPFNVLLKRDGRPKLADFGLARPVAGATTAITVTSVMIGTPNYMAPEQLSGQWDHRADIYALGVTFYEMLTGELPRGAWLPPSRKISIDGRIDAVITRALQWTPEQRYQKTSDMKADVEAIRQSPTHGPDASPAEGVRGPLRSAVFLGLAGIALLVLIELIMHWIGLRAAH